MIFSTCLKFPFLVFFKTVTHVAAKVLLTLGYKINYFRHTFLHKTIPCTERISIGLHVSIQHAISALVGGRNGSARTRTKRTRAKSSLPHPSLKSHGCISLHTLLLVTGFFIADLVKVFILLQNEKKRVCNHTSNFSLQIVFCNPHECVIFQNKLDNKIALQTQEQPF